MNDPRVIVALDFPDAKTALGFADRVEPSQCRVKVGNELFTAAGPTLVEELVGRGFGVFLDLKFHDIPNTVAAACRAAASLGVWMLNVHASGGKAMLHAARNAVARGDDAPKVIAVTLLTSMSETDVGDIGMTGTPDEAVTRLARLSKLAGLDGVVCSAQEASALRVMCGTDFTLVTPGIRPADAVADDQHRVVTPAAAIAEGSNYLVIGRPITRTADPLETLARINADVESAVARLP